MRSFGLIIIGILRWQDAQVKLSLTKRTNRKEQRDICIYIHINEHTLRTRNQPNHFVCDTNELNQMKWKIHNIALRKLTRAGIYLFINIWLSQPALPYSEWPYWYFPVYGNLTRQYLQSFRRSTLQMTLAAVCLDCVFNLLQFDATSGTRHHIIIQLRCSTVTRCILF